MNNVINLINSVLQKIRWPVDIEDQPHLVFEICFPCATVHEPYIFGQTITPSSAGTFSARMTGITPAGKTVYRSSCNLDGVKYVLIRSQSRQLEFVVSRNFDTYQAQWSNWENCDFATNTGNFFWLATRNTDRSEEANRVACDTNEMPKIRFRIMRFEDYLSTIRRDTDTSLDNVAEL